MASRGQPIWAVYTAWNSSTPGGQTGDVANHTIRLLIDGVDTAPTNDPSEWVGGSYKILLTSAECTADTVSVGGTSSTPDVAILPTTYTFEGLTTLADGAITEAKITLPAEATGLPTGALQLLMWVAGWFGWRKVVKDATTITQYMADGTTVKTSSTYASASGTDTINKAS